MNPLYFPPRREKPRVGLRGRLLTLLLAAILLLLAVGRALAAAEDSAPGAELFFKVAGSNQHGQPGRFDPHLIWLAAGEMSCTAPCLRHAAKLPEAHRRSANPAGAPRATRSRWRCSPATKRCRCLTCV